MAKFILYASCRLSKQEKTFRKDQECMDVIVVQRIVVIIVMSVRRHCAIAEKIQGMGGNALCRICQNVQVRVVRHHHENAIYKCLQY